MTVAAPAVPLLSVKDLAVSLGGVNVVRDVSLRIDRGEVVGLIGPNGAGKTSVIRAATRLIAPAAGEIQIGDGPLPGLSRQEIARRCAVVQQAPQAPDAMRVEALVLLGRHPHLPLLGRESERDYAIAREAMQRAGCLHLAERRLGTLSGGERRRAFIARALAQQAELLLLDEPAAALDVDAANEMFALVRSLAAGGAGILAVVHDLSLAASYCDRLVLMHQGAVVAEGPPRAVLTEANVQRVYGRRVAVIAHPRTGAPLVVPAGSDSP